MSTPIGRTGLTRITAAAAATLAFVSSTAKVAMFDDFVGDVLADQWNYVEGTDASPTDAAVLAGGIGGVLRMSAGDAGTGLAADLAQLNSFLNWRAANGDLVAEARIKSPSALTDAYVFFGFTDLNTLEGPIVSAASANTLTSNATDAVGFMFDTRMTTDNIWLVGVKNDVDAVHQDSGKTFVVGEYMTLRVVVTSDGKANFYINGVQVGTEMAAAITPTVALTPTVCHGNTANTVAKTMDVDYVAVSMNRGTYGAAV